ncbi:hypothetical protein P9112_012571 [Eukaryota sp. TZLM1-RC]
MSSQPQETETGTAPLPSTGSFSAKRSSRKSDSVFPLARIKKIIQSNEDIGKMNSAVPTAVATSVNLFITGLVKEAASLAQVHGARILKNNHLRECIEKHPDKYRFLQEILPVEEE